MPSRRPTIHRFSWPVSFSSTAAYWPVRPMTERTSSAWRTTSSPATEAVPPSGCSRVASTRTVVVLPAPFGPSRPSTVPSSTVRLTPCSARVSPKRFWRSWTSMMGDMETRVPQWLKLSMDECINGGPPEWWSRWSTLATCTTGGRTELVDRSDGPWRTNSSRATRSSPPGAGPGIEAQLHGACSGSSNVMRGHLERCRGGARAVVAAGGVVVPAGPGGLTAPSASWPVSCTATRRT